MDDRPRTKAPVIWNRPAARWGQLNAYWHCDMPAEVAHTNLAIWLLHSPKTHPAWEYWMVSLIHLRSDPRLGEAVKQNPEHTHELMVAAVSPGEMPPNPAEPQSVQMLRPYDLVQGFAAVSDAEALSVVERMLERFIDGHLPPDSDFARQWQQLLLTHPGGVQ